MINSIYQVIHDVEESYCKSQVGGKQWQAGPKGLEAGYTPKSRSNVSNIWSVNSITSSLMFTSSN